jgi:hypothetical protein
MQNDGEFSCRSGLARETLRQPEERRSRASPRLRLGSGFAGLGPINTMRMPIDGGHFSQALGKKKARQEDCRA